MNFGFGFLRGAVDAFTYGLGYLFPFALERNAFCTTDIEATYSMILIDTFERTHGLDEKQKDVLPDSCVRSAASKGLISLLACAMTEMSDLYLVYNKGGTGVLRKATNEEQEIIRKDYAEKRESSVGVYISFQGYTRTQRLRIYSELEYCILVSLNKSMNLAKAIQLKINDLRKSGSLADSTALTSQATDIAEALGNGQDILLDAKDIVETATPDISPTEKAIAFLDNKKSFILSLPMSYISGVQTAGIGSTGENDSRAVERGLKQYFNSIVKPACKALFGVEVEYRSNDFREISTGLEAVKTLSLVDESLISHEEKRGIIAPMFNLDPNKKMPKPEPEVFVRPPAGALPPGQKENPPA